MHGITLSPEYRVLLAAALPEPPPGGDAVLAAALRAPLDWNRLVASARREGTAAILLKRLDVLRMADRGVRIQPTAVASCDPPSAIPDPRFPAVPASVLEALRGVRLATLAGNLVRQRRVADVDAAFAQRGIAGVLLKGALLLRTAYTDPGQRGMGDIDVLVEPGVVPAADAGLRQAGFARTGPLPVGVPVPGLYLNSVVYADNGGEGPAIVHLHWHWLNASFPMLPYGTRLDPRFLRSGVRTLAGLRALAAPAPEAGLLHLCEHAFKHGCDALIRLVDIAVAWRAERPAPGAVAAAARHVGLERAAGLALGACGAALDWGEGRAAAAALLDGVALSRAERAFLRGAGRAGRARARCWWVYLGWQEGLRGKLAFVGRTAFPPREDLRRIEAMDREPGLVDYAGRLVRGATFALRGGL